MTPGPKAIFRSLVFSACLTVGHTAGTGKIAGEVLGAGGTPVARARVAVLARPLAPPTDPFEPFDVEVTAGADGKFIVTGVPQGRFAICASSPNQPLLPNCTWEAEPVVALAA